jgi:hypothetical protein
VKTPIIRKLYKQQVQEYEKFKGGVYMFAQLIQPGMTNLFAPIAGDCISDGGTPAGGNCESSGGTPSAEMM